MLRSAFAGLALRRSSASLRLLPSCQPAVSFSDNTTAGRRPAEESNKESPRREEESNQEESNKESPGASAEESNEESPGAKDKKKAMTKRKATQERFSNLDNRSTSSRAVDDFADLYMMMHLLNEDDDCRHDISRSKGSEPAAAVAVPPDHLDEDEPPVAVQGSSTEPAGATTAEDSSPATTDSSSCTAESSSPSASGDSSCSGGWWESGNSWGWGDSSYSGSDGDFSGDYSD